jgi:uncharacterized protein (DUF1778 family)
MNSSEQNREEVIAAYVDPDMKREIKAAARKDGRSISSYVARALDEYMRLQKTERRLYGASR